MVRPNFRELNVLKRLGLNTVESPANLVGAGAKTLAALLSKGWIERAYDEYYGVDGFRLTEAGNAVWEQNYRRA